MPKFHVIPCVKSPNKKKLKMEMFLSEHLNKVIINVCVFVFLVRINEKSDRHDGQIMNTGENKPDWRKKDENESERFYISDCAIGFELSKLYEAHNQRGFRVLHDL